MFRTLSFVKTSHDKSAQQGSEKLHFNRIKRQALILKFMDLINLINPINPSNSIYPQPSTLHLIPYTLYLKLIPYTLNLLRL